jgi:hypothetical protein
MRRRRRYGRQGRLGRLAVAVAMVIASGVGFLVTSAFTASNTVPATYLSSSTRTIGANDLKPAGCNSLNLTTVVTVTGSFANSTPNALVLGDSGNSTGASDTTGNSCIIAGAGNDHIAATTGDFCQIGPSSSSKYTNCSTF